MLIRLFIVLFFLAHGFVHGQGREQTMEEVKASQKKDPLSEKIVLDKKELDELQPTDVGDALTKIPGISLKNYGGLGGLKTFSYRGIGSEHNTVLEDGFVLSNAQVGQVNLGNHMAANLDQIAFGSSSRKDLLPVSAQIAATNLMLTTRFNEIDNEKLNLQAQLKLGSFGQIEPYFAVSQKVKRLAYGVNARYLHFEGDYPYVLHFGDFPYTGVRQNNQLTNLSYGLNFQFFPDSSKRHRWSFCHQEIDQGLPSAVILYGVYPSEHLTQATFQVNYDFQKVAIDRKYRVYFSLVNNTLSYTDYNYQNTFGYLQNNYELYTANGGWVKEQNIQEKWSLHYGIEVKYDQLQRSNRYSADSVLKMSGIDRMQIPFFVQLERRGDRSRFALKAGSQLVHERRVNNRMNPLPVGAIQYSIQSKNGLWTMFLQSCVTNRLPSFAELYFGSTFNTNLKNEQAFQNSLDISRKWQGQRHSLNLQAGIYWNKVWNKLVATPNKNLFQWTILNVGEVHAFGDELRLDYQWLLSENAKWRLEVKGGYNNQFALDADRESVNFGQQIAYVPFQTITADAALRFKASGLRIDYFWSDFRYALNQNTHANFLPSFDFLDLSIFHKFKTSNGHFIRVQASVKNLFNESYYFVRSYPMPGRNYLISVSYAL